MKSTASRGGSISVLLTKLYIVIFKPSLCVCVCVGGGGGGGGGGRDTISLFLSFLSLYTASDLYKSD